MLVFMLIISTLVNALNTSPVLTVEGNVPNNTAQQTKRLEVQLSAEKHLYKKSDELSLKVMVINNSDQDIFVYGNLGWGYLASLTLRLKDANGRDIQPKFISDAVTYPPSDKSEFVKLLPFHFLGTYYVASIKDLNIQRAGKYSIYIEYHSPIPSAKADVTPFFGKENGMITSKPIQIEVQ